MHAMKAHISPGWMGGESSHLPWLGGWWEPPSPLIGWVGDESSHFSWLDGVVVHCIDN